MRQLLTLAAVGVLSAGAALAQTSGTTSGSGTTMNPSMGTSGSAATAPMQNNNMSTNTMSSPNNRNSNEAVNTTGSTSGAPASGANSFTEAQARSRIESQGFQNVMGLTKNEQGVWMGQAMKDGRQVNVMLDFKGDVTTR